MAANTGTAIRARVTSLLVASPFSFTESPSPFDFELQPEGVIDQSFAVQLELGETIGGSSFSEQRVDRLLIRVARAHQADIKGAYSSLTVDATSIVAAIVRDGEQNGGDYAVPDSGRAQSIEQRPGQNFAVLRLTVPVDYEAQL